MGIRFVYFLAVLELAHCELVSLTCADIKKFIDGHNLRRLKIAQGAVLGQPAASKMNSTIWDKELAAKAASWASRNKFSHNPDRQIPSKRFEVGENIYEHATTDQSYKFDPEMALTSWFNEILFYEYKTIKWTDISGNQPNTGHYTQMIWSDTIYVGCAISQYSKYNKWKYTNVVCNYGPPGNFIGQAPYQSGLPSERLICSAKNCDRPYGKSC